MLAELCHYVGHLNAVKTSFSVRENLAFWAEFLGPNDGSLDRALAAFGLGALAELPAGLLSAGQKRKLALSRLFTASRPIWLLDEPQVSLDAASLKLLDKALKDHLAARRHRAGGEPHAAQDEICAQACARRQGARRMMRAALALLLRDVKLAFREGGAIGVALGFYLVVVAITPLGLGPDLNLLSRIAPGMLWVALLLAALLSADRIFHNDYEDGALDVLITGPLPLPLVAAIKSLAHWLTTGVPLALIAPLLGLLLNLPLQAIPLLVLSMLAGTPAVSFVAAIGASLTLGLAAQRASARAAGAAALRAGADLRRRHRLGRNHRPRLALAAVHAALRVEPGEHRARAARRRRGAPQCAAVNYFQSCHSPNARHATQHHPNTKRVPV